MPRALRTSHSRHHRGRIYERLDSDFYEPRIASLKSAEQDLLLATARCSYPSLNASELNTESPKSTGNINVLLGRLVGANALFRERKGAYRYTAPGLRDFLGRRSLDEGYGSRSTDRNWNFRRLPRWRSAPRSDDQTTESGNSF